MKRLEEIRALLAAATRGPWKYFPRGDDDFGPSVQGGPCGPQPPPLHIVVDEAAIAFVDANDDDSQWPVRMTAATARLIAQAPTLLAELVERCEELQDHLNTFCKCPSHGPSLVQVPDGEFDE